MCVWALTRASEGDVSGGFADLHHPQQWTLDHVRSSTVREAYEELVARMTDALDFMKTIHAEVCTRVRLYMTAGPDARTMVRAAAAGRDEHQDGRDVFFP
jgi:hypothetical protein